MAKTQIYHNPRCSKSRETLKLLQEKGEDLEIIEYLQNPPSTATLEEIFKLWKEKPEALVRNKEERFKELGLDKKPPPTVQEWTKILNANPILMERPLVVKGKKVALGRPPEAALEIL